MELPSIAIDEILRYFSRNEHLEFRLIDKEWNRILVPSLFKDFKQMREELPQDGEIISKYGYFFTSAHLRKPFEEKSLSNQLSKAKKMLNLLKLSLDAFGLDEIVFSKEDSEQLPGLKEMELRLISIIPRTINVCLDNISNFSISAQQGRSNEILQFLRKMNSNHVKKLTLEAEFSSIETLNSVLRSFPNLKIFSVVPTDGFMVSLLVDIKKGEILEAGGRNNYDKVNFLFEKRMSPSQKSDEKIREILISYLESFLLVVQDFQKMHLIKAQLPLIQKIELTIGRNESSLSNIISSFSEIDEISVKLYAEYHGSLPHIPFSARILNFILEMTIFYMKMRSGYIIISPILNISTLIYLYSTGIGLKPGSSKTSGRYAYMI